MKASDLFVSCLENEKVEYIFGVPGEENLDLLHSLESSDIKFITTRHEQSAAFMAATYGRLTGKAGVVLSTLGPGATNLLTGVAHANSGGMPLVVITGQKPISENHHGRFQVVDVVNMMKPVTKQSTQIESAQMIASLIRNAFKVAEFERPGAVHIELPEDIAKVEVVSSPLPYESLRIPTAESKAINRLSQMIFESKNPVVMLGASANRERISISITKFIEKHSIPFFSTQLGKGIVDERVEHNLGTAVVSEGLQLHELLNEADLLISVGYDLEEKPPIEIRNYPNLNIVSVHFHPFEEGSVFYPTFEVVGDIANSFNVLTNIVTEKLYWRGTALGEYKEKQRLNNFEEDELVDEVEKLFKSETGKIELETLIRRNKEHTSSKKEDLNKFKIENVVSIVRSIAGSKDIVSLDNGLYKLAFAEKYPTYSINTLLLDNALATMGAGLPAAITAKLINPENKVIAVVGDGGFLMNSQTLETAVRLNLDLTAIILSDQKYGMIDWKAQQLELETDAVNFNNPDFLKLAESYNASGYELKDTPNVSAILREIVNQKGVKVVVLPVEYNINPGRYLPGS